MPLNKKSTRRAPRLGDSHPHADKLKKLTAQIIRLRCENLQMRATGSRHTMITRFRAAPRPAVKAPNCPTCFLINGCTNSAPYQNDRVDLFNEKLQKQST